MLVQESQQLRTGDQSRARSERTATQRYELLSEGNLTIFKDTTTKAQIGKAVRTTDSTKHVILGYNEFSLSTLPVVE